MEAKIRKLSDLQSSIFTKAPIQLAFHKRSYSFDAGESHKTEFSKIQANGKKSLKISSQKQHFIYKDSKIFERFQTIIDVPNVDKTVLNQQNSSKTLKFQPKYKEEPASSRFAREFYGRGIQTHRKRSDNLHMVTDIRELAWYGDNLTSKMNPKERKEYHLESSIFNENKIQRAQSVSVIEKSIALNKKAIIKKDINESNDENKRKDQLSSDLFGRVFRGRPLKDSRSLSQVNLNNLNPNTGKTFKFNQEIRENKENAIFDYKSKQKSQIFCLGTSRSFTDLPNQKPKTFEFILFGLQKSVSPRDIKSLCGSLHVMSVQTDTDLLTGKCKGTGKVKIRTSQMWEKDLKVLRLALAEKGISIKKHAKTWGLHNEIFASKTTAKTYTPVLKTRNNIN